MATSSNPLPNPQRGEVVFHALCRPALTAGDYRLEVSHTLNGGRAIGSAAKLLPGPQVYPFVINAPRFTLDPSLIHSVFPPTNGVGSYVSRLPMIVLRRRTLPWERELAPGNKQPWLAVLLFEKGEMTTLSPCTVGDVLQSAPAGRPLMLYTPDVPVAPAERAQPCLGIELPLSLFREIAPMASEVELLTHVRQVNTEDKELMGQDDDGWFSVVVGNRLPEPGKQYEACLVSLEGTQAFLPTEADTPALTAADLRSSALDRYLELSAEWSEQALLSEFDLSPKVVQQVLFDHMVRTGSEHKWSGEAASVPSQKMRGSRAVPIGSANINISSGNGATSLSGSRRAANAESWTQVEVKEGLIPGVSFLKVQLPVPKVRLFLLAQWSFECREGGDFQAIMQALPHNGGVALLGMPPALAQAPGGTGAAAWRAALDTGHVPLPHLTREGEQTLAWYRGPLTSVGVQRETAGPYHSADQARRLDPATGLENLGYAAAFEIGRLMALGDPRFALDLMQWRRSSRSRLDRNLLADILKAKVPALEAFLAARLDPRQFLQLPRALTVLGTTALDSLMRGGRLGPPRDPTGLVAVRDRLPGFNPAMVADAKGLRLDVAQSLIGSLALGGSLLDEMGFTQTPLLETKLDVLVQKPAQHFGPQMEAFNNLLRGAGRPR